jgi:hypothetical protein
MGAAEADRTDRSLGHVKKRELRSADDVSDGTAVGCCLPVHCDLDEMNEDRRLTVIFLIFRPWRVMLPGTVLGQ